jgi:hypothetical protein
MMMMMMMMIIYYNMWNVKKNVIGATESISKSFRKYLSDIPGKHII